MTDFPSPSDRPKRAKSMTFGLFRPVLFAIGVIGLAMGGLVLSHRSNPEIASVPPQVGNPSAAAPAAPAPRHRSRRISAVILADSQPVPPPVTAADFGKAAPRRPQRLPAEAAGTPAADAEPPASDIYELTLRLEKGDTVEKMLADIDVPEADRKQIAEKLPVAPEEDGGSRSARRSSSTMQTMPEQPDAPRVLSLSVRPQPEREYIVTPQRRRHLRRRGEDLQGQPAHRAGRGRARRLAAAERHQGRRAVGGR